MNINFDALKSCDLVLTTSLSLIADGIRIKSTGIKDIFNTRISTHVGMVIPISDSPKILAIAEMLPDGLHLSSFSKYLKQGYLGSKIIDIRRFEYFETVEREVRSQILKWWEDGKKYDFAGVLKYVLPFLKDKKNSFYCSEMCEYLALNFAKRDLLENKRTKDDNIKPYDIQKSTLTQSVKGWRI